MTNITAYPLSLRGDVVELRDKLWRNVFRHPTLDYYNDPLLDQMRGVWMFINERLQRRYTDVEYYL